MTMLFLDNIKKGLLNYKVCYYCYINTDPGRPIKDLDSIPCKEKLFHCHIHKPQQLQTGMYFPTFEITFSQKDKADFSKRREQTVHL